MQIFETLWDNLCFPLFKMLWQFYWNPAMLLLYGSALVAFVLIAAALGWYTINPSPEHAVACTKLSWYLAYAVAYFAFVPVMLAANDNGGGLLNNLSTILIGYILLYLPILLVKFVFNKIPLINLAGPFLLYVLTMPYAFTLKLHGNLGYEPEEDGEDGAGVHYYTY